MFRKIHSELGKDEFVKIIIYSFLDILVGIFIRKILSINLDAEKTQIILDTNEKEGSVKKNRQTKYIFNDDLIEIIYLFNPLSIISCIGLQLRLVYNFLLFSLIVNFDIDSETGKNTKFHMILLISLFSLLNILSNPASLFIIVFYFLRNFYLSSLPQKFKILIAVLVSICLICCFMYVVFDVKEFYGVLTQNTNYFFVKDSLPNIGLMWSLFPEVSFYKIYYFI